MSKIKIQTTIHAPIGVVWKKWTDPSHITKWAFASDDWECPKAENDLRVGGNFLTAMAARDGSFGFEIIGTYSEVEPEKRIVYAMTDGREVITVFSEAQNGNVEIVQEFDPESTNSEEKQRAGWQSILDRFKAYAETSGEV